MRFSEKEFEDDEKEIKDNLLNNDSLKISENDNIIHNIITENLNNQTNKDNINYVYMIQLREFLNTNIVKIGRTSQDDMKRIKSYPKGSQLLLYLKCDDCIKTEKDIINLFKTNYTQKKDYGLEYFEGDIKSMIKDFCITIN